MYNSVALYPSLIILLSSLVACLYWWPSPNQRSIFHHPIIDKVVGLETLLVGMLTATAVLPHYEEAKFLATAFMVNSVLIGVTTRDPFRGITVLAVVIVSITFILLTLLFSAGVLLRDNYIYL